jgi:hypothetical protein
VRCADDAADLAKGGAGGAQRPSGHTVTGRLTGSPRAPLIARTRNHRPVLTDKISPNRP